MGIAGQPLVLILPPVVLCVLAQWYVHSAFHGRAKLRLRSRRTGAEAAQAILTTAGVRGVRIEYQQGCRLDYYDPFFKTLRLSPVVFEGQSIAAIALAAHEAGHAIQDKMGYAPLRWRSVLVPLCHLGNMVWFWLFLVGFALRQLSAAPVMLWIGITVLLSVVLIELFTLPTEFHASRQAKAVLVGSGLVSNRREAARIKRALDAAALTCLGATVAIVPQVPLIVVRLLRP
ncbi:MAG: zinc metallopeptidase [Cyanobacteriota bacterium]|jgi:Zn-dependent membrane protease YugP